MWWRAGRRRVDPTGAARPTARTPLVRLGLLAVDVETTGLDPRRDEVLAIGWVPVDGREILLAGARRVVVRPGRADSADPPSGRAVSPGVGHSAVFHGLTDDVVAEGVDVAEVLRTVLEACSGRALLAHNAGIEVDFLAAACRRHLGATPRFDAVDTMDLAARVLRRSEGRDPGSGELRLSSARERHGLPVVRAHDALRDAVACAELYLAQTAELETYGDSTFADVRWRR